MKVLNLYSGIGGNRKLWQNVEVTAVENDKDIARIYKQNFPDDSLIIGDAHKYLLEHYTEYDFIWSSVPCTKHSKLAYMRMRNNDKRTGSYLSKPDYIDVRLWQEIIFLKHFATAFWVVENVQPYYKPLIPPTARIERHYFWSNFHIDKIKLSKSGKLEKGFIAEYEQRSGFNLDNYKGKVKKATVLRNCVLPEVGLHVLNCAIGAEPPMPLDSLFENVSKNSA